MNKELNSNESQNQQLNMAGVEPAIKYGWC